MIAYLNSKSDAPLPIPAAPPEAAPPAESGTPTTANPAPGASKAPDVDPAAATADAAKQPADNIGGPGASPVTGTSKQEEKVKGPS